MKIEKIDPQSGEVIETYGSSHEAARKSSISRQSIVSRCDEKYKTGPIARDGYIYRWADEGMKRRKRRATDERKRKVEKLDASGKVVAIYDSVTQAAKMNGKCPSGIVQRCKGRYKNVLGQDSYEYRYH